MPIRHAVTTSRLNTRRLARRLALAGALSALLLVPAESEAQAPRPRVKLRAHPVDVTLDTLVFARDTVSASMGETFAAVRAVYTALKLPRDWADSANGQLGTLRHRATYTLGGQRLSVYFNCGQGIAGANADTWRLNMALVTFLQPAGDGKTRIGTGIVAEAQDMSGTSTEPAMCGSMGLLESRIHKEVRAVLDTRAAIQKK
jgi:hypothetical protein